MPEDLCTAPRIISLSPLSLAIDVTDATLGASGLWLGTRTGAGTAILTERFFDRSPLLHAQQVFLGLRLYLLPLRLYTHIWEIVLCLAFLVDVISVAVYSISTYDLNENFMLLPVYIIFNSM